MEDKMTLERFEAFLGRYGADLDIWPEPERSVARGFAETKVGKQCLSADLALDGMLAFGKAATLEAAGGHNADAFAERLLAIPSTTPQAGDKKVLARHGLWQRLGFGRDLSWLSPAALVSQATVFIAVLGLGILAGMNSAILNSDYQTEYAEIDLSETMFVSGTDFYLGEE